MRPLTLNWDSSATSKTLPQRGQFGRLRSSVAITGVDDAWHAVWTIIVDPPQRLTTSIGYQPERHLWRCRDNFVKVPWRWIYRSAAR
jgi:hypothetical protein